MHLSPDFQCIFSPVLFLFRDFSTATSDMAAKTHPALAVQNSVPMGIFLPPFISVLKCSAPPLSLFFEGVVALS